MTTYAALEYRQALQEEYLKWLEDGKCSKDPELPKDYFFPRSRSEQRHVARYCYDCPVRLKCAEYACITETPGQGRNGVWGGLTEAERNTLMKELHRQRLSVDAVSRDGGKTFRKILAEYSAKIKRKAA